MFPNLTHLKLKGFPDIRVNGNVFLYQVILDQAVLNTLSVDISGIHEDFWVTV